MQLSPNFSYQEFIFSSTAERLGIDNNPMTNGVLNSPDLIANFKACAEGLERVRTILGDRPIHIDSGYRCIALNAAIDGAVKSAHLDGYAADILCNTYGTPDRVFMALCRAKNNGVLTFDQLIVEGSWVHISFAPTMREQTMIAHFDSGKKVTYSMGA